MTDTNHTHDFIPSFLAPHPDSLAGCDPDFDATYADLHREFAAFRNHFSE